MKVTVTVCDVCEGMDAGTKRYEIKVEGRKVNVDLCEAHSQPLQGIMGKGTAVKTRGPQKAASKRTGTTAARRRAKVTPMSAVEAAKKK